MGCRFSTSTPKFASSILLSVFLLLITLTLLHVVQIPPRISAAFSTTAPAPSLASVFPAEAYNQGATDITITGTGFFTATETYTTGTTIVIPQVTLDNVTLPEATFVSSTSLTATVPADLPIGPYTLTVTNPDGQEASLSDGFAVLLSGNGDLTDWQTATSMGTARNLPATVIVGNWIYALGGSESCCDGTSSVERAQINADGSLSPWQTATSMNTPRWAPAAVAAEGYIYVLGGQSTTVTNTVERAEVNSDGSLGPWQNMNPMNNRRNAFAAVKVGRYIYAIGSHTTLERAEIQADGTLGVWEYANDTNIYRSGLSAVVAGNYVYVLGGIQSRTSVERAEINADDSLGAWEVLPDPMPTPRNLFAAVVSEGYLYALGGEDGSGPLSSVDRAMIHSDGSLGAWQTVSAMTVERKCVAAAAEGGHIYAVGGVLGDESAITSTEYSMVNPASIAGFTPSIVTSDHSTAATIQGGGLIPSPTVRLGSSTFLTVGYVSPVSLTADIPAGLASGWYSATLTNGDGRIATLPYAVRVDGPGPIAVEGYGLTINDGALFTNNTLVTLTISSRSDTALMQVSNDGGFSGASWETYTSHKAWTITQYGNYIIPRVVYVRYQDIHGNISATFQDDIILDVTAPTGSVEIVTDTSQRTPPVGDIGEAIAQSIAVSDTSDYTFTVHLPLVFRGIPSGPPNVVLQLDARDDVSGVAEMLISNRSDFNGATWESYATSKDWYVPPGTTTTVYVKFQDYAGNVSEAVADTIEMP